MLILTVLWQLVSNNNKQRTSYPQAWTDMILLINWIITLFGYRIYYKLVYDDEAILTNSNAYLLSHTISTMTRQKWSNIIHG